MADRNEPDSPDESSSSATPPEGDDFAERDVDKDALSSEADASGAEADPGSTPGGAEADPHVASEGTREPTLEELEQMLEGDDPTDHDGADLDSAGEPAELSAEDSAVDGPDGSEAPDGSRDGELVSVGAVPRTRSKAAGSGRNEAGTEVAPAKKEREKKDRATAKQKREVEKPKRTTPVGFVKEAVGELRKVVYPTAPQLGNYFVVVLAFVLFIIAFVGLLDAGFAWLIVKVFG